MSLRRIVALLGGFVAANLLLVAVGAVLLTPLRIPSASMAPALQQGDRILADQRAQFADLQRGDLVVFRVSDRVRRNGSRRMNFPATDKDTHLVVKRVIGLPGEKIESRGDIVAIDQTRKLDEPYASTGGDNADFAKVTLAGDEVWVMGDSRAHSKDSRFYGAVPASAVVGTVVFRFWPIQRAGRIS